MNLFDSFSKEKCIGCKVCVQQCPVGSIRMKEDEEGFSYPEFNQNLCVDCGKCLTFCPSVHYQSIKQTIKELAVSNRDKNIRFQSSSGGVFSALAEAILRRGGVVFGARFDVDWGVIMDYTESAEKLELFRGSKYVEANTGDSYFKVEEFLKQGRNVLYVSTPCLVAGLKNFLVKDYDNLYAVDLGCWGVAPKKAWLKYLNENTLAPIKLISFRCKLLPWKDHGFLIQDSKGMHLCSGHKNSYMNAYFSKLMMRPSCECCCYKHGASGADITISDFWHVNEYVDVVDDNKGVNFMAVYTEKGNRIIPYNQLNICELIGKPSYFNRNKGLYGYVKPHPKRHDFLIGLNNRSFEYLVVKYLQGPLWLNGIRKLIRVMHKL